MSIEEKRRVLFEAWWQAHKGGGEAPIRYRGQYVSDSAIWAWIGFNAALDAVVIELPQPEEALAKSYGPMLYLEEVIDAIESTGLGLKVK